MSGLLSMVPIRQLRTPRKLLRCTVRSVCTGSEVSCTIGTSMGLFSTVLNGRDISYERSRLIVLTNCSAVSLFGILFTLARQFNTMVSALSLNIIVSILQWSTLSMFREIFTGIMISWTNRLRG